MARRSPIRSGGSTSEPSNGSARRRRWSSGTRACRRSRSCSTRPRSLDACWRRRGSGNAMPSLRDLERDFARALLGEGDAAVLASIRADGLAPAARFAIYRNHVFVTLTDALGATYPVVRSLVDARFFVYAADRYVHEQP